MRQLRFELRAVLGLGRSDRWPLDEWLASYEEDMTICNRFEGSYASCSLACARVRFRPFLKVA